MSDVCDWCDGAGCEECQKKPKAKAAAKPKAAAKKAKVECDWCDGEGCEECQKKPAKKDKGGSKKDEGKAKPAKKTCDWCDGEGCESCGGGGGGGGGGDDADTTAGPEKCDFCGGSGCDACRDTQTITPDDAITNAFVEAEDEKSTNSSKALESFKKVVDMAKGQKGLSEETQTNVFKSLQYIVSILFQLKRDQEAVNAYKDMLDYFPNVSQNESDTAVEAILSDRNTTKDGKEKIREQLYEITSSTLAKMSDKGNMLFAIQMKQCQELVSKAKYKEAQKLLEKVHDRCRLPDGRDDQKSKGSELIEIYALELKIAAKTKNVLKTRELYEKTKDLTAAVKNPKSQSVIRECWGKMFGDEGNWGRAYTEFYSAFTSYQEAGDPELAKNALKYVVVANMLSKSELNPFSAREARVYQNDPEITPIINLRAAYDKRDVEAFGKCLEAFYRTADDYIQSHMNSTVDEFQRLTALKILKSYNRIKISELATKLQINAEKTESLLIQLILDGKLNGKIDQVKGILDLSGKAGGLEGDKYQSLDHWSWILENATKQMQQPAGARGGYPMAGW